MFDRSHSDLCFYAIKDGEVVNDETKGDLFSDVNTTAQCSAASSCPADAVSVSYTASLTRRFHDSVTWRNATHRTAPQFRRHAAGTCGKIQRGSNCLRNDGGVGMPLAAASS